MFADFYALGNVLNFMIREYVYIFLIHHSHGVVFSELVFCEIAMFNGIARPSCQTSSGNHKI